MNDTMLYLVGANKEYCKCVSTLLLDMNADRVRFVQRERKFSCANREGGVEKLDWY